MTPPPGAVAEGFGDDAPRSSHLEVSGAAAAQPPPGAAAVPGAVAKGVGLIYRLACISQRVSRKERSRNHRMTRRGRVECKSACARTLHIWSSPSLSEESSNSKSKEIIGWLPL